MGENVGPGLVAVVLFVVLLVVGVVRGVVGADDGRAGPPTAEGTTSTSRGGGSRSTSISTASTLAPTPEDDSEPESVGVGTEAAPGPVIPVGPSIPSDRSDKAQAVATEVLRADVSGEGRERFAGYWGEDLYRPCCHNVVVHASVARALEGREEAVVVSMVWSAEALGAGPPREQVQTDIYLVERDGSWAPIRPAGGGA